MRLGPLRSGAATAAVAAGGIPDTVVAFGAYPGMAAFDRAAASAAAVTESEFSLDMGRVVCSFE
jgi:hypothetical protein